MDNIPLHLLGLAQKGRTAGRLGEEPVGAGRAGPRPACMLLAQRRRRQAPCRRAVPTSAEAGSVPVPASALHQGRSWAAAWAAPPAPWRPSPTSGFAAGHCEKLGALDPERYPAAHGGRALPAGASPQKERPGKKQPGTGSGPRHKAEERISPPAVSASRAASPGRTAVAGLPRPGRDGGGSIWVLKNIRVHEVAKDFGDSRPRRSPRSSPSTPPPPKTTCRCWRMGSCPSIFEYLTQHNQVAGLQAALDTPAPAKNEA